MEAFQKFDITNPLMPIAQASIQKSTQALLDGAADVFQMGNIFYIASYMNDALQILQLSYDDSRPSISPVSGVSYTGTIQSIDETLVSGSSGQTKYQISKDG